eukprot:TRINITY_DN699_c1_g1_i1.p2 TRINITY_DN699_c1_g1~~TRINITY_DN699_c1_g1_i1.p2  ORF type:complete len:131 (+),score=25.78 TRINITY_DN699_c1_g1_i1:164-556(+)
MPAMVMGKEGREEEEEEEVQLFFCCLTLNPGMFTASSNLIPCLELHSLESHEAFYPCDLGLLQWLMLAVLQASSQVHCGPPCRLYATRFGHRRQPERHPLPSLSEATQRHPGQRMQRDVVQSRVQKPSWR